jgi:pimeloyl-ACP methyl ester carboxylesterase
VRPPDLPGIRARVLLIRGRYDRMVPVEVSIAFLNHIADSRLVLLHGRKPLSPSTRGRGLLIGHNGSGGR